MEVKEYDHSNIDKGSGEPPEDSQCSRLPAASQISIGRDDDSNGSTPVSLSSSSCRRMSYIH